MAAKHKEFVAIRRFLARVFDWRRKVESVGQ
jgi:hypothetical protein